METLTATTTRGGATPAESKRSYGCLKTTLKGSKESLAYEGDEELSLYGPRSSEMSISSRIPTAIAGEEDLNSRGWRCPLLDSLSVKVAQATANLKACSIEREASSTGGESRFPFS